MPVSTERVTADNGAAYERCPYLHALGIPHGFGTRRGGLRHDADRLLAALRVAEPVTAKQVHGAKVLDLVADPGLRVAQPSASPEGDALVSGDVAVAIYTADCVPILMADRERVAAVHAGWRGAVAGVHLAALRHLRDPFVSIGPAIGGDVYEVGDEVRAQFPTDAHRGRCVDVRHAVLRDLLDAGVPEERITVSPSCTFEEPDRFASYRRDGKGCGHMLSVIAPR